MASRPAAKDLNGLVKRVPFEPSATLALDDVSLPEAWAESVTDSRDGIDLVVCRATPEGQHRDWERYAGAMSERGRVVVLPGRGGVLVRHRPDCWMDRATVWTMKSLAEAGFAVRTYALNDRTALIGRPTPFRAVRGSTDLAPSVGALFARSFHHEPEAGYWSWKFDHHPRGGRRIGLLVDEARSVVAQYAAHPVRLCGLWPGMQGNEFDCYQICDIMTDSELRGVGRGLTSLHARSIQYFYSLFCTGQTGFTFGFNTGSSAKGTFLFAGGGLVCEVPYRELRREAWNEGNPQAQVHVRRIEQLDGRFDTFFERARKDYDLLFSRRRCELEWRYLSRPGVEYEVVALERQEELLGWAVVRSMEDGRTELGDFLLRRACAEECLSATLQYAFRSSECAMVCGWFSKQPQWLDATLGQLGFTEQTEPDELKFVLVEFGLEDAFRQLQERLFFTKGDSDLF